MEIFDFLEFYYVCEMFDVVILIIFIELYRNNVLGFISIFLYSCFYRIKY